MSKTGIFGKHPAFGDFIAAGMSKPMQVKLEEWLGAVLPRVRDNLGDVWQPFYDIALPLRFWIGEAALPRDVPGPVAGVMVFSHDKVGRRFPLVALSEAGQMPPPTIDPDQRWYDALQGLMLEHDTPETAADLSEMFTLPTDLAPAGQMTEEPSFWAVHSAGQTAEMLANVAATDHRRAARPRSYWWCAGDRSRTATFHTLEGWPAADVFQWLLAGNPAEEEPDPEPTPQPEPDAFLTAGAVAAASDLDQGHDPWADEGAPKVPTALYAPVEEDSLEDLPEDGPQSPFSLREAKQSSEPETPSDEDAVDEDQADAEEIDAPGDPDPAREDEASPDRDTSDTKDADTDPAKPAPDAFADEAE